MKSAMASGERSFSHRRKTSARSFFTMKRMSIGIMGTPVSSGNRGVLALGSALSGLCVQAAPGGEVFLLLANRDSRPVNFRLGGESVAVPVVNARMSPVASPREQMLVILFLSLAYRLIPLVWVRRVLRRCSPWIDAVASADVVGDVRGGDSFSDIYGLQRFVLAFLPVWSVLLIRGTMVQFPQTYGPFRSPVARWLGRFILRRSSVIVARDTRSQAVAQEMVGPAREVRLSPDVAFSLEVVRPERVQTDPPVAGGVPLGVVGLNVNGLMWHGGYTRDNMFGLQMDYAGFLKTLVPALLRQHSGEVWLVPHTFAAPGHVESDQDASRALRDALPADLQARVRIVTREYDQYEIKGVIGQCDFFIGSRMHACIAALSQGVPCVGVAYSMKFAGVFDSVGAGEWVVDGRSIGNEEALARVLDLYGRREALRGPLSEASAAARGRLQSVFSELMAASADAHGTAPVPPAARPQARLHDEPTTEYNLR